MRFEIRTLTRALSRLVVLFVSSCSSSARAWMCRRTRGGGGATGGAATTAVATSAGSADDASGTTDAATTTARAGVAWCVATAGSSATPTGTTTTGAGGVRATGVTARTSARAVLSGTAVTNFTTCDTRGGGSRDALACRLPPLRVSVARLKPANESPSPSAHRLNDAPARENSRVPR